MRFILTLALPLLLVACATARPQDPVIIELKPGGALYIGDQPTTFETFQADLRGRLGPPSPKTPTILVKAAPNVLYGDFMGLMNLISDSGYRMKTALIEEWP